MKSSKVSNKTRSTPASLSFKGQASKHTTVKWSIAGVPGSEFVDRLRGLSRTAATMLKSTFVINFFGIFYFVFDLIAKFFLHLSNPMGH